MRLIAFITCEASVAYYIEQEDFGGSDTSSVHIDNDAIQIDCSLGKSTEMWGVTMQQQSLGPDTNLKYTPNEI